MHGANTAEERPTTTEQSPQLTDKSRGKFHLADGASGARVVFDQFKTVVGKRVGFRQLNETSIKGTLLRTSPKSVLVWEC